LSALAAIVRKDLQLFRSDRRAVVMQIVAPIVISGFFGFVFSRGGDARGASFAHAFAGMSVQFILFAGIHYGVGLLADRQRGVWKRLRAAPLSKSFVLSARAASGALVSFMTLSVVFAVAIGAFGVRVRGSLPGFVAVLAAIALLASTFGLLVATLGRTPEATRALSGFAVLLMVMLGGAWVPTSIFPPWLQTAALVVPARWAVDGIEAMTWRGQPFAAALPFVAVLVGFAAAFAAVAALRFRWEAD
jgi:ABC-2 type transport system permease protein